MPMDALCLSAVRRETEQAVLGGRIDKIHQPSRDEILLHIRSKTGACRLLLTANPARPRMQLTQRPRENPAEPPMFCMLLRKYLTGGKILELRQPPMERLAELVIEASNEMGDKVIRRLILEAMGRRTNLLLLDGEGRIVDCLRRVDVDLSQENARPLLPGRFYKYPPMQAGKLDPETRTPEDRAALLSSSPMDAPADKFLMDHFLGLSPLIARELAFRGDTRSVEDAEQELAASIKENNFTPICLRQEGKHVDFSYLPITQYGTAVDTERYGSFCQLLDDFYEARERMERTRQRGADLIRSATTARDRLRRKLALQEKDYAATQNREQLRISGDLITANLYRMERGQTKLVCENYYDENCAEITIQLDPLLTPQQNAAKYYKRYTKAKTAEKYLREQMDIARRDLEYLESILEEIAEAETEQDFLDIRSEMRDAGFLRRQGKGKKEPKRVTKPREFRTTSGLRVLVGRNNRQNDKLTMKDADHRDLWFHTQKIHGSHVILCTGGMEVDDDTIVEAAKIAAWYSQARTSGNIPVDYTQVKHVKKPAGARPGMVVYHTCRTVNVTPEEGLIKRLFVK